MTILTRTLCRIIALLATAAVAAFAVGSYAHFSGRAFINADAWSIYDMARSFDETFYHSRLIRQFNLSIEHGSTYPFLGPVLLYAVDALTGLGVYALYATAAVLGWCGLAALYPTLRKAAGENSLAVALAALLAVITALNISELYLDLYRASTIPIALAFILAGLALLPGDGRLTPPRAFAVGAVMGLAALTRFDVNLFVLFFTGVMLALARQRRVTAAASYAAGVLIVVSPWIVYSLLVFGRLYASDNMAVALSVRPHYSVDLLLPGEPSAFTDPAGWYRRIAAAAADFLRIVTGMVTQSPFAWLFLATLSGLALLLWAWSRRGPDRTREREEGRDPGAPRYRMALTGAAAVSLLFFVGPIITSYQMNTRYYSTTFLVWAVMLLGWGLAGMVAAERRLGHSGPRIVFETAVAVLCVAGLLSLPTDVFRGGWPALGFDETNRRVDPRSDLLRCVPADGRTLLLYNWSNPALQDGIRFGALARRDVVIVPGNWAELPAERKIGFLEDVRISHALLDEAEPKDGLVDPAMALQSVAGCPGLYRIGRNA